MHLCNYFHFKKLNPGQVFTATGAWFASKWVVTVGVESAFHLQKKHTEDQTNKPEKCNYDKPYFGDYTVP